MLSSSYELVRKSPFLSVFAVVFTLTVAAGLTYRLGGTATAYPHLFYVPIVVAAALYRAPGGIVAGAVAGLLCGPWMPVVVELGIPQTFENWLIRLVLFVFLGALVGTLVGSLHDRINALRDLNEQTIVAFVRAVDAKDAHTAEHSLKVAEYACAIAVEMGLAPEDVIRVRHAALLHDIGKLAVPAAILNKPDKLTPEEWERIKRHPLDSANIIADVVHFKQYIPGVRHHHERLDGHGYPDGLRGDAVPLDARIIAVADAFDAMTSDRAYRARLTEDAALGELKAGIDRQFDKRAVEALSRVLASTDNSGPRPDKFSARWISPNPTPVPTARHR